MSDKVENRNRTVLDAALTAAEAVGYRNFTRQQVAESAGVAAGTVSNAYGDMEGLRDAVMAEAVARESVRVVAQGLADRHPAAVAAPEELKRRALDVLAA